MDAAGLKQRNQTEDSVSGIINHPAMISLTSNSTPGARAAASFWEQMLEYDRQFSQYPYERSRCLGIYLYPFMCFFEVSGNGLFWIPATALIWLLPAALAPETRAFVFNLFIVFIIDLIVVGVIKGTVKRSRPVYNEGHVVVLAVDHWSFPSGHSTRAVMIATLVWLNIGLWKDEFKQVFLPHLLNSFRYFTSSSSLHNFPVTMDEEDGFFFKVCFDAFEYLGTCDCHILHYAG